MWLDDYNYVEEDNTPQVEQIVLDEDFTESARLAVQGGLKNNFVGETKSQSSSIIISSVAGVGLGIYFGKSPVIFGIIGAVLGTLLIKLTNK